MSEHDTFARSSAARAWKYVRELERQVVKTNNRLLVLEASVARSSAHLRRCVYCGAPSAGPVCASHADLMYADALAPKGKR